MDLNIEEIYVELLNEGTKVYRPTSAIKLADLVYVILAPNNYDSTIETWKFVPGMIVNCKLQDINGDNCYLAVSIKQ